MTTRSGYSTYIGDGFTEWSNDTTTIQQENGRSQFTFEVMLSEQIIVGPYPGSPDSKEWVLVSGEAISWEMAHAVCVAALVEADRQYQEDAEAEAAMYAQMEADEAAYEDSLRENIDH